MLSVGMERVMTKSLIFVVLTEVGWLPFTNESSQKQ